MIDFEKHLTLEQKENVKKRKEYEALRTVGTIIAFDTEGNIFEKTCMIKETSNVFSFGWPCEYYLDDLYNDLVKSRYSKLSIDISGLNHKGHEVFVKIEEILVLLKKAMKMRDELRRNIKCQKTS